MCLFVCFLVVCLFIYLFIISIYIIYFRGVGFFLIQNYFRAYIICTWCDGSSDRSPMVGPLSCSSVVRAFVHGAMGHRIDPTLNYFSYWCNKHCGMCYPVCGMMHIKEPLLLIGKSSPCGGSGFSISLSEWYFTICLTPYNSK